jgi:hypothetical protein
MTTPVPIIEEKLAEKAELEDQLRIMEKQLKTQAQRLPSFGTHHNFRATTHEDIVEVKRRIAEIDRIVERMARGNS